MKTDFRKKFVCILFLIVLLPLSFKSALAENWPCFRGPTRQGISSEKNVPLRWSQTSNIIWKTPVPGIGWSSPIVFDDRVFVTTAAENGASFRLLCLDKLTGKIIWDKQIHRQIPGHKQRFNSYASSTPATDGRYVYVLAFDGTLAAVSYDGDVIWKYQELEYYSEHGLAVSPVLYRDLVIVPFDYSSSGPDKRLGWQISWDKAVIIAVNKNTGKVQWTGKRGLSRIAHVTPQILTENGRDQLISSAGNVVQGFDLDTGQRIWTAENSGEGVVPSVVLGEGLVFVTSGFGDSMIRAIRTGGKGDVTQTHIVWESDQDVSKIPSMLYVKPFLFFVTDTGVAKCLRAATGEEVWRNRLQPKYSASPIWADGRIYFLSEKGVTTVIPDNGEFKVLAENDLNEKCIASPAVSNNQIFIRSENNIYCIGHSR